METLPDVLGQIFSHLSHSDILTGVLPVCRRWQAAAQAEVLSRQFVFRDDHAVPPEEALRLIRAIPNLQLYARPDTGRLLQAAGSWSPELRRLTVEHCFDEHSALTAALGSMFRSCEQLTDLTLNGADIGDSVPFCQLLGTTLRNLCRLTIICCIWFGRVIDSCPQMQQFCTKCRCSDANISRLAQRWGSSLQALELMASQLTDAGVAALDGCSQLRSLQLGCWRSPGVGLRQLATLAQLEQLELCRCQRVGSRNIRDFFSQSRSAGRLRKINLIDCAGVDDGVLSVLSAACPCVEDVSLADSEQITAAARCERDRPQRVRVLRELPLLGQPRRLNIDAYLLSPIAVDGSVRAQMPDLNTTEAFP